MDAIYHIDAYALGVGDDLRPPFRDANGFLHIDGRLARVGVTAYPQPNGTVRRELTTAEMLFEPKWMAALVGAPVTELHPHVDGQMIMVTPENARQYQRGSIASVRRSGDYLVAEHVVTDAQLIGKIERKELTELSPGYLSPVFEGPGVWTDGERYDGVQGFRIPNHVAVVPLGRCSLTCGAGPCKCDLRTDGAETMKVNAKTLEKIRAAAPQPHQDAAMVDVSVDSLMAMLTAAYKIPPEALDMIKGLLSGGASDEAAEEAALPGAAALLPTMAAAGPAPHRGPAQADAPLLARFDALEAENKALRGQLEQQAKHGAKLQTSQEVQEIATRYAEFLGPRFDAATATPLTARLAVLKAAYPEDKHLDGYDDATARLRLKIADESDPTFAAVRANAKVGGRFAFGHVDAAPGQKSVAQLREEFFGLNGKSAA